MSNPYAPPENRPRPSDGDQTDAPATDRVPTWSPAPPPVQVERTPPDPEGTARAARHTRLFGVLVLGSVLVATLPLPWQAASLVFALGGVAVGIRALVVAARAHSRSLLPMLSVGVVIALSWTFLQAVQLAFWPVQQDLQDCLRSALTIEARTACESQYERDLEQLQDSLLPSGARAG
ncbi:hypothetical protein [Cellulomonas fengjieae]|uniref:DUF4190 domain-containing protein n=1 Tax=Cellulomonas fengjieae TaxID=2819978 RepID=A0ABS3SD37_9CELL|nr:hypothetical protein [Cellulomonas fengjieae]MBO3083664.1 hypothetical protein [Cellulomonas fengjieae]MBO3101584.1 hypothetical protein [Cellulomonas fengjieae]QVI65026.1 hypothetical protein KG102_12875 [Cellulomonas fengjieae]